MTPDLLPLLAASFACISVLALFVRHNKRTGWVKPLRLTQEDLAALGSDWRAYPAPVRIEAVSAPPSPEQPFLNDRTDFTMQLANFQKSLASAAPVQVEERERVTA
jgi:hypothetical protein